MSTSSKACLYETHSHTPLCKHAQGLPGEFAATARKKGLKGLIVTCHSPMRDNAFSPGVRMSVDELPVYCDMVQEAREAWEGRVDVLLGMESDFYPGAEPWLEELHGKADFHYILGSVHPHIGDYKDMFYSGNDTEYQKLYFTHLALAAESGLFDTLSHPDLIKNAVPKSWDVLKNMDHIKRCLDRIAKAGTAMELNTSGVRKSIPEMLPGPEILQEIQIRNIPVVMGADAHKPEQVGDHFLEALTMLRALGFRTVSTFKKRVRSEIPLEEAIASLDI